jgi:hypothetical protein
MFLVEYDAENGVAIVVLAPPATDADWTAYGDTIESLNQRVPPHVRPVLLQFIGAGTPFPTPLTRRRMANLRAHIRADAVNVVVSTSHTVRGVQIALDWIRKPHYDSSSHADAAAAMAHAEKVIGKPLPALRALHAKIKLRM